MEDVSQEVIDGLLDPNNHRTLAFVDLAYSNGAVTPAEIREWVWHMLDLLDEEQVLRLPPHFFDLAEFAGTRNEDFEQACGPCCGPFDRDIDYRR